MHRTKESLQMPHDSGTEKMKVAHEAAAEEAYEMAGGASSTDGVGPGYDANSSHASRTEIAQSTADGPASGEMTDPPHELLKKRKKKAGVRRSGNKSNHAAANSTKSI